jgi:hydrogenase maturation protein HypF
VVIEIEGDRLALDAFWRDLEAKAPKPARIDAIRREAQAPDGETGFAIRPSLLAGDLRPLDLVDRATCADCVQEIFDSANRRYLYPFITCTACGPRFSILDALPYDRARTAMAGFAMCDACREEYQNPADRRFHAETQACPDCGPALAYHGRDGDVLARRGDALDTAAADLRVGKIVAIKGLGGFQLLADARNEEALARLRQRKRRPDKPFALMVRDLDQASALARLSPEERAVLASPAGPIVILDRRDDAGAPPIAPSVAPSLPWLGLMLPTTPLHCLLLDALGFPIVATSGNRAGEPMAIELEEALARLATIADRFLSHDRPIRRALDDSVQRLVAGRSLTLRRARGLAPLIVARDRIEPAMLALGGQEKAAVAIAFESGVVLGPHVGDLDSPPARTAHQQAGADLSRLYGIEPALIVGDRHPDYASTDLARRLEKPVRNIQHHAAHIFACMADNRLRPPLLGFAFDGTGYGEDGTIWGGEAIMVTTEGWRRVASLRPFHLPGGEMAIREPRRIAIALLLGAFDEDAFRNMATLMPIRSRRASDLAVLKRMIETGLNAPLTSSFGRLFDGVAAILGLRQITSYSGQAAVELEGRVAPSCAEAYPFGVVETDRADRPALEIDWRPAIRALATDVVDGREPGVVAAAFHNGVVAAIVDVAKQIGEPVVALSGGCFQNRYLTERAVEGLEAAGFVAHWHRDAPPNDGGLAVGQIACAAFEQESEQERERA